MAERVLINEVAPRDGFQSESMFVPSEDKIRLIDRLSSLGLAKIEVTSFVSPKAVPMLRDAAEVMAGIARRPGVVFAALAANEKGAARALAAGCDEINLVMSIGEAHNLANVRMTCEQSLEQFRRITELASGTPLRINGTVATAFSCPFDGKPPRDRIDWAVERYLAMGMHSITLADTVGMAHPRQVAEVCLRFLRTFAGVPLTLHFHDTRGMGLANVMAALDAGARRFDASLGGIGGCPYAPGATGNICTEDAVHMLESCGADTGVDLDGLLAVARDLPGLLGHPLPGRLLAAGRLLPRQGQPPAGGRNQ